MPNVALPSFQSLLVQMKFNGKSLATGTAFVVNTQNGPWLVTNRHNVTGRSQDDNNPLSSTGGIPNEITIVHNRKDKLGHWVQRVEHLYDGENHRWREHPQLGANADFVALPLTQLDDVGLYPYDVTNTGPDFKVGPADIVSIIGFPFGITAGGAAGVWVTGFLASEPTFDFNGLPIILVDCRSRKGQSGSPVIAYRTAGTVTRQDGSLGFVNDSITKFIGIYSGRINRESDLGIIWKASAISDLVRSL